MRAKLFTREESLIEEDLCFDKEVITIGRDSQNNIVLNNSEISRKHARLFFDDEKDCYVIEDLGSRNGTLLDDTRVKSKEPLTHLHVISFAGRYDFIFQDLKLCKLRHSPER